MTLRCLELINIPDLSDEEFMKNEKIDSSRKEPQIILDLGCGSGLSGDLITKFGHFWMGFDISPSMLKIAQERDPESNLCLSDMGHGMNMRPGFFDAIVSVSALQWLCTSDKSCNVPWKRLTRLFESCQKILKIGGKAVFQIYPENPE